MTAKRYSLAIESCSRCKNDLFSEGDLPIQLQCGHIFHQDCIHSYINAGITTHPCSYCRKTSSKKRIYYEILPGYQQIFVNLPDVNKLAVLWICQDSTFEELELQLNIQYDFSINSSSMLKTQLGKIITLTEDILHMKLYEYSICPQQTFELTNRFGQRGQV